MEHPIDQLQARLDKLEKRLAPLLKDYEEAVSMSAAMGADGTVVLASPPSSPGASPSDP